MNARNTLLRCATVGRFGSFLVVAAIIGTFVLHAQPTDEEKTTPVRRAHAVNAEDETPSPTPKSKTSPKKKKKSPSPSPKPTPKKKKTPTEESATSAKPSETPEETPKPKKSATKEPTAKGKKKKKTLAEKSPSSKKKKKTSPKPSETPETEATAPPLRAIAVPSPSAPPSPVPRVKSALAAPVAPQEPEQLTIEKYGYEKPRGFWSRIFGSGGGRSGSGAGYRYLTASVRAQIDRAPVARGRWQYIVVHNSGTRQGNAAAFDYYHRHFRRMQNGLAYHFVIGNGTSTGNGQVEVGDRWRRQINGGHVHSDYLNNIALGICLVGDFNRDQPTRAQLDCCEELIRYLRQRCGKVGDHYPIVKPHREVNPPRWATDCPGDVFPYSWFRRFQE